jgi:hypothetical protein
MAAAPDAAAAGSLVSIEFRDNRLRILNQLLLPAKHEYEDVLSVREGEHVHVCPACPSLFVSLRLASHMFRLQGGLPSET